MVLPTALDDDGADSDCFKFAGTVGWGERETGDGRGGARAAVGFPALLSACGPAAVVDNDDLDMGEGCSLRCIIGPGDSLTFTKRPGASAENGLSRGPRMRRGGVRELATNCWLIGRVGGGK